jgi:hypothetical protein
VKSRMGGVHGRDLRLQRLIPQLPLGRCVGAALVEGRGGRSCTGCPPGSRCAMSRNSLARRPRTTMRYDRARVSLDRHATYIVATYIVAAYRAAR